MTKSGKFIIACPARSGSTMLVHLVRSHPDCVSNSEVMALTDDIGGFDHAVRATVDNFGDEDELVKWRREDPVDFMNRTAFYADDRLWGGFKIKSDELVLPQYASVLEALRADRSIKVLHLNRSNLLERYVSWLMVNDVTGVTMAVRREDVPEFETVKINPKKAERDFVLAEQRQAMIDQWFAEHDMLQLEYEALTLDPVAQSKRICDFLDVESRVLTTRTIKIAPHVSTLVSNFAQLQDYFAGSRFEPLFTLQDPSDEFVGDVVGRSTGGRGPGAYRIPGHLRTPRHEWGVDGGSVGAYLAAACDLPDLSGKRLLAVGHHTDAIEEIANGELVIGAYVGLESSRAYVAHCAQHPPAEHVQIVHAEIDRLRDDTQWLVGPPFDVIVVREDPETVDCMRPLAAGLRKASNDGARLIVPIIAGDERAQVEMLSVAGWRADEARPARRSIKAHLVCTASADASSEGADE